jgi:hypothetical protein
MFTTNAIRKKDFLFIFKKIFTFFHTTNVTFLLLSRHEVAKLENKSIKGKRTRGRSLLLKRQSHLQSKINKKIKDVNYFEL